MTLEPFTRLESRDIELLNIGLAALEPSEADGEALWLRSFEDGRQWIIETKHGCFCFQVDDHTGVPDEHGFVPVSDRIRRFCLVAGEEGIDLLLAGHRTVIAQCGSLSAAVDTVMPHSCPPSPWQLRETATMVVSAKSLADLLASARTLPSGVCETEFPVPPMWLQISDESVGLHVDWTDFGVTKATYRLTPERRGGHALVAIPHRLIENALRMAPLWNDLDEEPVDLTVAIGTTEDDRRAISLRTDAWNLWLWLSDPLEDRWAVTVDDALVSARGVAVIDHEGTEWAVRSDQQQVRIVLHHGHPDVARVSTPLLNHAEESLELLRELSQLNAASSGVRYWFADDVVWAACDVPGTVIESQLVPAITSVATAAALYRPMIAALAAMPGA